MFYLICSSWPPERPHLTCHTWLQQERARFPTSRPHPLWPRPLPRKVGGSTRPRQWSIRQKSPTCKPHNRFKRVFNQFKLVSRRFRPLSRRSPWLPGLFHPRQHQGFGPCILHSHRLPLWPMSTLQWWVWTPQPPLTSLSRLPHPPCQGLFESRRKKFILLMFLLFCISFHFCDSDFYDENRT